MRLATSCLVTVALVTALPSAAVGSGDAHWPLPFEENLGQTDSRVRFLARGPGYVAFLTDDATVLRLEPRREGAPPAALSMTLVGASATRLEGSQPLPGRSHYLGAAERSDWIRGARHFARVSRPAVYPGIDLVYRADEAHLAYDFVVAPGADLSLIHI